VIHPGDFQQGCVLGRGGSPRRAFPPWDASRLGPRSSPRFPSLAGSCSAVAGAADGAMPAGPALGQRLFSGFMGWGQVCCRGAGGCAAAGLSAGTSRDAGAHPDRLRPTKTPGSHRSRRLPGGSCLPSYPQPSAGSVLSPPRPFSVPPPPLQGLSC